MNRDEADEAIVKYLYEAGVLRFTKRTGGFAAGVKNPESVADHTHRMMMIAYVLGLMENANAEHCAMLALFHEMGETRIGDLHKIASTYLDKETGEKKAVDAQIRSLPQLVGERVKFLIEEFEAAETPEAVITKDADRLECAMTSREYYDQGYKAMREFMINNGKKLKTDSAKRLLRWIEQLESNSWWKDESRL